MLTAEKMEPLEPGNPFLSDAYHMGTWVGVESVVMFANHPNEKCDYLIVVDARTGERLKVKFE